MNLGKNFIIAVTTFFYIGFLPLIPGTFGSLAALLIFFFIRGNPLIHMALLFIILALGFIFSGRAEKILNKKDARCIVIDEVSGMLLALSFLPFDVKLMGIGFILFRAFDTLKPPPANRAEKLKGSAGIMSDDIIAGLYANIILQVVRIASLIIS